MWQGILYFISKIIIGVVVAAWGYNKTKIKNKNIMRQIDNLAPACRNAVLTDMVALAKAYEIIHTTGDSIPQLACDFGQTYLLTLSDFESLNLTAIDSWVGPLPPRPPRIQ